MPEHVCPSVGRVESGAADRTLDDICDAGTIDKADVRGYSPDEEPAGGALWAPSFEIIRQSPPHVIRKGEAIPPIFSKHRDLPRFPVDVLQGEIAYLAGTKAETCQKKENREVPPTYLG